MDTIKFGTDGWRGIMARDFTFENVRRVAQAIADYLKEEVAKAPHKKNSLLAGPVLIGYDRRFQSESFAREIAKVLEGNKLNPVLLAETLPTPAISFLTRRFKGLGLMVTASHNPAPYNGIKIKYDGKAALEPITKAVEACVDRNPPTRGTDIKEKSCRDLYLQYLKSKSDTAAIKSKLKRPVVVDYLYGAGAGLMEELIPSKHLVTIRGERDPLFGGINPEPIEQNLKALIDRVRQEKALIGIALDGDADRIGIIDDTGAYFTPCQVFPIIIEYLVTHKKLTGKIVQSVSMGYLSGRIAKKHGLEFEELPVGFKHVAEQLAIGAAVIAGEESGGYAWKGGLPERDGLLTGLLFLEMCTKLKMTPSQLWKDIETKYGKSHFKRVDFKLHKPVADKTVFAAKLVKKLPKKVLGSEIKTLLQFDGLKIILAEDHWILMRPSGTEPLMRVYAESDSEKRTNDLLDLAKKWLGTSLA
ncbi:MAG: phosphoglucomutase/phosphomannomutase family protein [Elusimicrobiota bacterium]